ncbi:DUF952 domain-containing protein [Pseudarthrobacter sp. J75]|uniref:DUF952 domain-containing protein n=1 Tax=unclassified Pseudarthrobacter TaxID=2647000 RepID=UPI002E7FD9B3|nr:MULTISPECIES: DUF952 domain-containing protein [unclassified Pseudarthrobacter]MEE2527568.1 DUF952 domain-containing protein [Pseudarthrobacter sp. J75]MEE2570671.1 DUF952 domain-containing protein [Pseudarthrobacter sp. J64]
MGGQRLVHVSIEDDWEACARFGEYEVSTLHLTLDQVGYIHATTASKLQTVLDEIYGDIDLPLLLAVIDEDALADAGIDLKWEASSHPSGKFGEVPRIIGALPMEGGVITTVLPLEKDGGRWVAPDLGGYGVRE